MSFSVPKAKKYYVTLIIMLFFTFFITNFIKRKKYKTISEIESKFSYNEMTIINNVFLNADHFSDDELKDFLERHWDINENKTVLKKIVVIYDYKKYK